MRGQKLYRIKLQGKRSRCGCRLRPFSGAILVLSVPVARRGCGVDRVKRQRDVETEPRSNHEGTARRNSARRGKPTSATRKLREAEPFRTSLLHSPLPILLCDDRQHILVVSQSSLEQSGYLREELQRVDLGRAVVPLATHAAPRSLVEELACCEDEPQLRP
jgi:PAS domain-containing protein